MAVFTFKNCLVFRRNYNLICLNSAQIAFANRIGIQDIPAVKILSALAHPKLSTNDTELKDLSLFSTSFDVGKRAIQYFTKEYLKNRFPELDSYSAKKYYFQNAINTFTANVNLLQFARFLGIEAAVGFKSNLSLRNNFTKRSRKIIDAESASMQTKLAAEIHSETFIAILGLMGSELGPLVLRKFLDTRYFNNSHFNPNDLVMPLYPIPELAYYYPRMVFRIHQESGRFSNNSIFIVGVYASDYDSSAMLGEGYGESIILAQHRAATEALRNFYLSENRVTIRDSDNFTHISQVQVEDVL